MLYNKFSDHLKKRYGTKVYKLPINLPVTCPNRDGKISKNGCAFCGEEGTGFENLPNTLTVREQLQLNARYIGENYKTEKFIVYFQNYSNTYLEFELFKKYVLDSCTENVVAIYISTRPDCINDKYLEFLQQIKNEKKLDIVIELGLQTVNSDTLRFLERGHGLAEFIDAVIRIKRLGMECCAHYITDIPIDSTEDVIDGAKIISALGVDQVKCHSLYFLKGTKLGNMLEAGQIEPLPMESFIERTIYFLEHLNPEVVIQRLLGRAPKERTIFCNWGTSWWKIQEIIEQKMEREGRYQGKRFDYLNGNKCMGKFIK